MPGPAGKPPQSRFPRWGSLVLPGSALWGTVLGLIAGIYFGNAAIGTAIGAGLGIGIGMTLFAAAVVIGSKDV